MIKLSVMYPHAPDAWFDHDYYCDKHMPLVQQRLGAACQRYTIDKGLSGATPGSPPAYVGMAHIYCESIDALQAALAPHAKELMADVPNYTNLAPVMQVSEVVVG